MSAQTTSERAVGVSEVPRDVGDRDRLREEWRLAALEFNQAEDNASRLEEGRKLLLDQLTLGAATVEGTTMTKAPMIARTSEQFRNYLKKMHDARRTANDLRVEMENRNRIYFAHMADEAMERTERRMSR